MPTTSNSSPPPPLTDTDIIRLAVQQSQTCLPPPPFLLSTTSHSTLLSFLHSRCTSSSSPSLSVTEYITSLISLLTQTPQNPNSSSLLSSLLLSYLRLFSSHKLPHDQNSSKVIDLFTLNINSIPKQDLPSLVDHILSNLTQITDPDDTQVLDFLPRVLDLIRSNGEKEGRDYVDEVFDSILESDWSKVLLVKIVSLLREFPFLDKVRTKEFLNKVFDGMSRVDLQDLPSLVYQLFVLASKGFSKRDVVEGVVGFFGVKMGSKGSSIVRQVEGTVLLHVNFAVKQDPSLGQEVLGLVRSNLEAFNHFTVVVLLSLARVRRFSECAIGILKTAVVTAYREHKFARDCKWLPDTLKNECTLTVIRVEKSVMRAINESNYGREHIVPSIVQFGFVLLESVEEENAEEVGGSDCLMGIEELSIQILKTLFDVHDMARNEIIEQCKLRILSVKPQHGLLIIRLLGYLTRNYPYPMLEHVARLKELLDYFSFMHDKISVSLVTAILPLIKLNRDLQDYTILVVRKALFRREDTIRLAATNAIINLIFTEKKSNRDRLSSLQESSSQASCSQQAELPYGIRTCLFQELSGLLQRCLSQQAKVKEIVYQGIMKFVLMDPSIAGAVFDFLLPHFLRFYSEDEGAHLNLKYCLKSEGSKICLDEPFDCFLSCVSWILLLQPHGKTDHPSEYSMACFGFSLTQENEAGRVSSGDSFSNALSNIRKLLRNGNLEEILGQSQDSGSPSLEVEKRNFLASILSGIIEVMLNVIAMELENATEVKKVDLEKELLKFIDLHNSLEKETRTIKHGNSFKRGTPSVTARAVPDKDISNSKECISAGSLTLYQTKKPFLATSSIHQLLLMALRISDSSSVNKVTQDKSQVSSEKTVQCSKLISFALKASLGQLKTFYSMEKDDPLKPFIYGDLKLLGPSFLKLAWLLKTECKLEISQRKKAAKGRKGVEEREELIFLCLICLKELIVLSLCTRQFIGVIDDLANGATTEGDDDPELISGIEDQHTKNILVFLEKRVKPLLSELLCLSLYLEFEVLSDVMLITGNKLPSNIRNSFGIWAIDMAKSCTIENPKAAKSVVGLTVYLSSPPNDLMASQEIASELLKVVGSEENDSVDKSESYAVINKSTKTAVTSVLLKLIESVIVDVDWAITKLKAFSVTSVGPVCTNEHDCGERAPGQILEEALYLRSEALVSLLSFFAHMNLTDTQAEQYLRLTARLYKQLALMTKLRIAPKGFKQLLPGFQFQKLAEITCQRLTAPLYNFVFLIQKKQQESAPSKGIISKIKRENRCVPDLIFQIEDYEKYLIQLTKLTKINLLRYAKRSTVRDFKIVDTNKLNIQEEKVGRESSPVKSVASENELCEDPEGEEGNESEKAISPELDAATAAIDSGSDSEGTNINIRSKRAKTSRIVQDSDDEA